MLKSKMSTSPVKITIAGNDFNLIANKAEEKKLTDAAQMVNTSLAGFDKLQSTGKQMEALTLCSLKLAGEILELRKQLESSHTRNLKHIDVIDSLLDKHLALHWFLKIFGHLNNGWALPTTCAHSGLHVLNSTLKHNVSNKAQDSKWRLQL